MMVALRAVTSGQSDASVAYSGTISPKDSEHDPRTRDRVVQLLMKRGACTAAQLGAELGLSAAGVRRHLDALQAQGRVSCTEQVKPGPRGRGRPAKTFSLTDVGRAPFPHAYDDLAAAALRHIADTQGVDAVARFAAEQVAALEERCRIALDGAGDNPLARSQALAEALTAEGYAASATAIASGGQLCQHNCPVAHVAAEFPQLCEAETAAIGRLVGSHVQRLATIAHGDGVCTTHIPGRDHEYGPGRDQNGLGRDHEYGPVRDYEHGSARDYEYAPIRDREKDPAKDHEHGLALTTPSGGTNA